MKPLLLTTVLLLGGPARESADSDAIRSLNDAFAQAMNAGDVDAILGLVTPDIVLMPPDAPPDRGREVVRKMFEGVFQQVELHEVWTREEVVVAGDAAYDWTRYTVTITPRGDGDPTEEAGQNVFVARRQPDGSWKYSRMIWNGTRRRRQLGGEQLISVVLLFSSLSLTSSFESTTTWKKQAGA